MRVPDKQHAALPRAPRVPSAPVPARSWPLEMLAPSPQWRAAAAACGCRLRAASLAGLCVDVAECQSLSCGGWEQCGAGLLPGVTSDSVKHRLADEPVLAPASSPAAPPSCAPCDAHLPRGRMPAHVSTARCLLARNPSGIGSQFAGALTRALAAEPGRDGGWPTAPARECLQQRSCWRAFWPRSGSVDACLLMAPPRKAAFLCHPSKCHHLPGRTSCVVP